MTYYTRGDVETMTYINSNDMNFAEGNVIKYVTRYKTKGGKDDLHKAKYYLDQLITNYHDGQTRPVSPIIVLPVVNPSLEGVVHINPPSSRPSNSFGGVHGPVSSFGVPGSFSNKV